MHIIAALVNIYSENIFIETLEGKSEGIMINGITIKNFRYATTSEQLVQNSEKFGPHMMYYYNWAGQPKDRNYIQNCTSLNDIWIYETICPKVKSQYTTQ